MPAKKKGPSYVHEGSVSIPIYDTPRAGYSGFTVVWYDVNGERQRKIFAHKEKAISFARDKALLICNGKATVTTLTSEDASAYLYVIDKLRPFGVPLPSVADEYAYARAKLKEHGVSLVTVVDDYLRRHGKQHNGTLVQQTVREFIASKGPGRWRNNLEQMLSSFTAAFACPLHSVSGQQVQRWLAGLKVDSARTRENYLIAIRALALWAKKRKLIPLDWDELDQVALPVSAPGKIEIFSPEEIEKILTYASKHKPELLPYLAIRAFSGVRFEEMGRITWQSIHRETNHIVLDGEITKTKRRRITPLLPNLAAWLAPYAAVTGPIAPGYSIGPRMVELMRAAGVRNRHNGLRDSFISYRIAATQNMAQVALEAGNSPAMIAASYQELRMPDGRIVTLDAAKAYFGVLPEGWVNVVSIRKEA